MVAVTHGAALAARMDRRLHLIDGRLAGEDALSPAPERIPAP